MEHSDLMPVGACLARTDPPVFQAVNDILVLDSSRFDGGNMMIHYHISTWQNKEEDQSYQNIYKSNGFPSLCPEPRSPEDDSDQHSSFPDQSQEVALTFQ